MGTAGERGFLQYSGVVGELIEEVFDKPRFLPFN